MTDINEAHRKVYRRKRLFINAFKEERGCVVCGEHDPVVLDLDHIDPSTKLTGHKKANRFNFAFLSWDNLMEELEKCQVLCANCHRRKTAREQGWNE